MALPVQACCWPVRLERWTRQQQVQLAWPVLVWLRQALQQRVWQLA